MKNTNWTLVIVLGILGIILLSSVWGLKVAHDSQFVSNEVVLHKGRIVIDWTEDGNIVTFLTNTPTVTPTIQPTVIPSPTPVTSLPLCTNHNENGWHSLIGDNCHYNHEHKHDPNSVNDIFGEPGDWFGGTSLSYPWQTPNENLNKHNAYGWIVRRDMSDIGIRSFRLEYHAMSGQPGTLTRFHSYSLEALVCDVDGCGIVRTGGWLDYGQLQVNGINISLDGQTDLDILNDDGRRRQHFNYPDIPNRSDSRFKAEFFWYSRHQKDPTHHPLRPVLIAIATGDAFSNVNPDLGVENSQFFCYNGEVFTCNKNGSTIQAHVIQFEVRQNNFNGWLDRYGVPVENCNQVSLDCIPLIIENAPTGRVSYRDDDFGITSVGTEDFDIAPAGEHWIGYPN